MFSRVESVITQKERKTTNKSKHGRFHPGRLWLILVWEEIEIKFFLGNGVFVEVKFFCLWKREEIHLVFHFSG